MFPALFVWYSISAQLSNASFLHYTTDQGLSNDHITAIAKDNLGFMWIGTVGGINRFDGRTFKIFRHDPNDRNSPPDDDILGITLAPDGWLWIATNGGLCRLDPIRLRIERITLFENGDTLKNGLVTKVAFDSKGMAWTTSESGIHKINPATCKQVFFFKTEQKNLGWYTTFIDKQDRLWLIKDTLRRFDPVTQTLDLFNSAKQGESFAPLFLVQDF
ncbi:MAG TPA: two-component regulator propeller domain-containing protein, partial [Saprospiraceae bacterium]|nr:two-component regulator propeller domain-containing protein [Saprospiraceae bacterium]